MQTRMYDIGWSGDKKCRGCDSEEGTEKHSVAPFVRLGRDLRNQIPEGHGDVGTQAKNVEGGLEVIQRPCVSYLLSGNSW